VEGRWHDVRPTVPSFAAASQLQQLPFPLCRPAKVPGT
jgi:hypothetical protein